MPMRGLLWHARAVIDDHAPGKSQIALKYGQDYIGLPSKALLYYQNALRVRVWRGAWRRGVLYTALLSLSLIMTIRGGRPYAQPAPAGKYPAPALAASRPFRTL